MRQLLLLLLLNVLGLLQEAESAAAASARRRRQDVVEFAGVRIEHWMFEFAMGAQIVAAGVGGATQGTLESAGEMHVIVVPNVRHHFSAQLTTMQIATTR